MQGSLRTFQCYRNLLLPMILCNAAEMMLGSKCHSSKFGSFPCISLLPLFTWHIFLLTLLKALGNFCDPQEAQVKLTPLNDTALCRGHWMGLVPGSKIPSPSCLLLESSAVLSATLTILFSPYAPVDALSLPAKTTQTPVSKKKPVPWVTKSKAASKRGMLCRSPGWLEKGVC